MINERLNADHFKVCPYCTGEGTVHRIESDDTVIVRGESFLVPVIYFECIRCCESFQPVEGDQGLALAKATYKKLHGKAP